MNEFSTATELHDDGTVVLSVEGELDMATAPSFQVALMALIDHSAVIVDLTDCEFLDSSALRVLVQATKHLNGAAPLTLIIPRPNVLKVFEITHLDATFDIRPTRAALSDPSSASRDPAAQGAHDAHEET